MIKLCSKYFAKMAYFAEKHFAKTVEYLYFEQKEAKYDV